MYYYVGTLDNKLIDQSFNDMEDDDNYLSELCQISRIMFTRERLGEKIMANGSTSTAARMHMMDKNMTLITEEETDLLLDEDSVSLGEISFLSNNFED
eukprot:2062715-Ditylum_brightwellii.AAC.1